MPRVSERVIALRGLTDIYLFAHTTSDLLLGTASDPDNPTEGEVIFRENPELSNLYDVLFDAEQQWGDLLIQVTSRRYLNERIRIPLPTSFDLRDMLRSRRTDFRQAMRTTPEGFEALLNMIKGHPIFISSGNNPQPPVQKQLAITLERLGSNGNGASVGRFARNYKVGRGSVINCTRRVISAILDVGAHYLSWPSSNRRQAISKVLERDGFPGCVGFVDGTTIPLFQRPGRDGEVFFDRKHRYSLNVQIVCDCDRRITYAYAGWPGSCCDSTVYSKTKIALQPEKYFDHDQYIIADSAYIPSETVVPSYKGQAADIERNKDFNWCIAKARVRNEHCIGILKSRWASLQGLRLALNGRGDMYHILRWIRCCLILHNMLADLGNAWNDDDYDRLLREPGDAGVHRRGVFPDLDVIERGQAKQESVRDHAVAYNWKSGGLPIIGS